MTVIIGLTGSIGCGKSTVSNYLRQKNISVIDADLIAKEITTIGKNGLAQIVQSFGSDVLNTDGSLNRRKLGDIVFNDPLALEKLNQITHPLIKKEIEARILTHKDEKILVLDIPLLFETNDYQEIIDISWLVIASESQQIERIMRRDGLTKEQALARINNQMPIEAKISLADRVIDNNGLIKETYQQVDKLLKEFLK